MTDAPAFAANADDLLANNRAYAADFPGGDLPGQPRRHVAVVTCMDSRIDPLAALGLANGDAHIMRNAGGVVTDDVIRSLCLSQRFLGTREILVIHHTDCGLAKVVEADLRRELEAEVGVTPSWSLDGFDDPYDNVRQSMTRLRRSPFIAHTDDIRGFVYDVDDGLVKEVAESGG